MDVFQCPECALKFRYSSEMIQHLKLDHPEFEFEERTIEDSLLHAAHRHKHKKRDLKQT